MKVTLTTSSAAAPSRSAAHASVRGAPRSVRRVLAAAGLGFAVILPLFLGQSSGVLENMVLAAAYVIMALGLTIAIERFVFLNRARSENRRLWEQLLPMLQSGKFKEVQHVSGKSDAAIGKIVSNGLHRMQSPARREDIDAAMEEGMMEIVPQLEKRTHYLATFANLATLLGLNADALYRWHIRNASLTVLKHESKIYSLSGVNVMAMHRYPSE